MDSQRSSELSNRTKLSYQTIAQRSGLSISTVSRVFNKSASVSEEKRERVVRALQELGADVQQLDLKPIPRNNLILFNVPSLKNPFYSPIIESARRSARRFGYNMLVSENELSPSSLPDFLSLLKTTRAAGVILTNAIVPECVERIRESVPVVTCCESSTALDVPYVTIDDESASEDAVKYLLSLGRRRIAMINGPEDFKYARERYKGYCQALRSQGLCVDDSLVCSVGVDMDYDMAKAHAGRMLSRAERPDAFFCISDVLASAAIKASVEAGLDVPRDIAVVGFDNIQISQIMNPTITTVSQPVVQLGTIAVELLLKVIGGERDLIGSIHLGCELVIRESTATFR